MGMGMGALTCGTSSRLSPYTCTEEINLSATRAMLAISTAINNNHTPDTTQFTTAPKGHFSRLLEQIRSFGIGFLQWT